MFAWFPASRIAPVFLGDEGPHVPVVENRSKQVTSRVLFTDHRTMCLRQLYGFRQVVPQVCTCRKLIVQSMLQHRNGWCQKRACADRYMVPVSVHVRDSHEATRKTQETKQNRKHNQTNQPNTKTQPRTSTVGQ